MEKVKGNKIRLGIFVSASFVLLIAAVYFIGSRQQLFSRTFQLSCLFKDISGLTVGNNVRFSGINIGIVDGIEQVTDSTVRVDMKIMDRSRKFIKKSAIAVIGSDGLMGNKIIVIVPGDPSAQVVKDKEVIGTTQPATFDDILAKLKVTSENAAEITDDLSAITWNIRNGKGTIGKLFMDSVFADNMGDAIVNIKQGAGGFKRNMDAASHNFLLRGYLKKKKKEQEENKEERKESRATRKEERKERKEEKKAEKEAEKK